MSARDVEAARYLEGGMDGAEREAFEGALASDPQMAAALARQALLEARLRRLLGTERERDLAAEATPRTVAIEGIAPRTRPRPALRRRPGGRAHGRSGRRRALAPVAVGLALVAALGLGWWLRPSPSPAAVVIAGNGTDAAGAPLGIGARVAVGTSIDSGRDGARLRLPDGSEIALGPDSRCAIDGLAAGTALRLEHGSARCTVVPQGPERGFRVALRHAQVAVVGTRFTLVTGPELSRLEVDSGRVRFRSRDQDRVLGPGEHATAGPAVSPGPAAPPDPAALPAPPDPEVPRITGFVLVSARDGTPVPGRGDLTSGERLVLDPARPVAIVARITGPVRKLRVVLDDQALGTEQNPPWALMGNPRPGDASTWALHPLELSPGRHRFTLTPIGPRGPGATVDLDLQIE